MNTTPQTSSSEIRGLFEHEPKSPSIALTPVPLNVSERLVSSPTKKRKRGNEKLLPLSAYIPIGCICFCEDNGGVHFDAADWFEVSDYLPDAHSLDAIRLELNALAKASWIRIFMKSTKNELTSILRLYLLPDDFARHIVNRDARHLRKALENILLHLNIAPAVWKGNLSALHALKFDMWATADDRSLFYMFNTLPSPNADLHKVTDRFSKNAMNQLLEPYDSVPGLKTILYPYQQRSAVTMLQREVSPGLHLDPRLEARLSPTEEDIYYYAPRTRKFYKQGRQYEGVKGGILAETMGLGKTLICLALILSTKGHMPRDPPLFAKSNTVRPKVGSLMEMAASAVLQHSIPWRSVLDEIEYDTGDDMAACRKTLEDIPPKYEIPPRIIRSHRNIHIPPSKLILKCRGTLIVVPRNLIHQWRSEILKHTYEEALEVLFMDDFKIDLPDSTELSKYDIILFSRERFEREHSEDRTDTYVSPLQSIHLLRIIIDEGHSFSSHNSRAVRIASNDIRADRRWVISGTPAKDLLGIEVDLAAMTDCNTQDDFHTFRKDSLLHRKPFSSQEQLSGAIKSLGLLARHFLKAQPWVDPDPDSQEKVVIWDDEIYRHEHLQKRTYTCFSSCLRRTLHNLVIKTQPQDVEKDIVLPPLTHEIVRLEPSFFDKLTANLFVLLLTTNAVASERTDVDYLFHPTSQAQLHRLIANLMQSGFNWTGLNASIVKASLEEAEKYLAKENTKASLTDRQFLTEAMHTAKIAMASHGWNYLTDFQEMGLFIDDWPEESRNEWSHSPECAPLMIGLTQSRQAQNYVNIRLHEENPLEGLKAAGSSSLATLVAELQENREKTNDQDRKIVKAGVPSSAVENDSPVAKRFSTSTGAKVSPKKQRAPSLQPPLNPTEPHYSSLSPAKAPAADPVVLPPDHAISKARIIGSTSAKLSYLLDRISALYEHEKILIFYSGDHIAYYLSQALDLLHIAHLVYTSALSATTRAKYVVLFDTDARTRVLLMDIRQAAHGLNLASASRVFFATAPCRPHLVAQALKRAHRIGQARPVRVETLLLRGSVEEAVHDQAARMTRAEHLAAKTLEDDRSIARIIQRARIIPVEERERHGYGQVAWLQRPQQLWGRPGREVGEVSALERALFPAAGEKRGGGGGGGDSVMG